MTSTGKKARRRYGTRHTAKRRREGARSGGPRERRKFGRLAFSVQAKNAPEGAVQANEEHVAKVAAERKRNGWRPDANVSVPGPTWESVRARLEAEERAARRERRQREED